jgi:hypothetical protein
VIEDEIGRRLHSDLQCSFLCFNYVTRRRLVCVCVCVCVCVTEL